MFQPDYHNLEVEVAIWKAAYVEHIRDTYGEEHAEATERDLTAKPWLALQWYVEDNLPEEQKAA